MKRGDIIIAAGGALWLLGAVASFWRASEASFVIADVLAVAGLALLALWAVRKLLRRITGP